MAALDPSKSAFSKAQNISIVSPMGVGTDWRSHVVDRVTSLSKAAVVAVGLTMSMGTALAHEQPQFLTPITAEQSDKVTMEWESESVKKEKAKFKRMEELSELYFEELSKGTLQKTWSQARPNLKVATQFGDQDMGRQSKVSERAGMTKEDFSSPKTAAIVHDLDLILMAIGGSEEMSAAAISLSNSFFKPGKNVEGSFCTVSINPHIGAYHDEAKRITNWPDDIVRDIAIRHELTHCIEQSDRSSYLSSKLANQNASVGPLLAEKSIKFFEKALQDLPRADNSEHPDDQVRLNIINATRAIAHPSLTNNAEEISDALSVLSLIKEGRLGVDALGKMSDLRSDGKFYDADHDTSSLLKNLEKELLQDPDQVRKWQRNHAQNMASGEGLQIKDLLEWATPRWKAHADARNEAVNRSKSIHEIPGFPVDANKPTKKNFEQTMSHFSGFFKFEEKTKATKPSI